MLLYIKLHLCLHENMCILSHNMKRACEVKILFTQDKDKISNVNFKTDGRICESRLISTVKAKMQFY